MIIKLDLESAFDKIDHNYMEKVYEKLNIGKRMKMLLMSILRNMYSCITVNGAKTRYFKLQRSIRQGDPSAMVNFILASEPLANIIREHKELHPIKISNQAPRVSLNMLMTRIFYLVIPQTFRE